jgi:hypothetical protein
MTTASLLWLAEQTRTAKTISLLLGQIIYSLNMIRECIGNLAGFIKMSIKAQQPSRLGPRAVACTCQMLYGVIILFNQLIKRGRYC